jgi:hypothetical protein
VRGQDGGGQGGGTVAGFGWAGLTGGAVEEKNNNKNMNAIACGTVSHSSNYPDY